MHYLCGALETTLQDAAAAATLLDCRTLAVSALLQHSSSSNNRIAFVLDVMASNQSLTLRVCDRIDHLLCSILELSSNLYVFCIPAMVRKKCARLIFTSRAL